MSETNKRRLLISIALAVFVTTLLVVLGVPARHWKHFPLGSSTIQGAVVRRDGDARNESPIANATITVFDGVTAASARSDDSGYFSLTFHKGIWPGRSAVLQVRHPDYQPLDLPLQPDHLRSPNRLYIAAMAPNASQSVAGRRRAESVVSDILVRYTTNSQMQVNLGSAVKTFQVANTVNTPCDHKSPCSPDGNWKASTGSLTLDAGADNEFSNVRSSCIAGPCPFTQIDSGGLAQVGQHITVSAINWSSTATFLVEAEVEHTAISSNVRESYPVVFGRSLSFTLPPTQEGVSIEAEIDGSPMVFPLGPDLFLSWATCTVRANKEREKSTVYSCVLKPGYKF